MKINTYGSNSQINVLGIYASINGIGVIVVQYTPAEKPITIIDEIIKNNPGKIESVQRRIKDWVLTYKIKYFFGNEIAESVYEPKTHVKSNGEIYQGWERIEISAEHMMFLVQCNLTKLAFNPDLIEVWKKEIDNFELEKAKSGEVSYLRINSLACVLKGVELNTTPPLYAV